MKNARRETRRQKVKREQNSRRRANLIRKGNAELQAFLKAVVGKNNIVVETE